MRGLPTWWYRTEHFWLDYPHPMTPEIKTYYLLQLSYWIQQMLVLVLKIEKPRSDYVELCIRASGAQWLANATEERLRSSCNLVAHLLVLFGPFDADRQRHLHLDGLFGRLALGAP
jgi:hypothetical protein